MPKALYVATQSGVRSGPTTGEVAECRYLVLLAPVRDYDNARQIITAGEVVEYGPWARYTKETAREKGCARARFIGKTLGHEPATV